MSVPEGFRITGGKGLHITFPNGVTVSVQFGRGNYAGNSRRGGWNTLDPSEGCPDAEVAVAVFGETTHWLTRYFTPDDDWADNVRGYQSPSDVAAIIAWASALTGSKIAVMLETAIRRETDLCAEIKAAKGDDDD